MWFQVLAFFALSGLLRYSLPLFCLPRNIIYPSVLYLILIPSLLTLLAAAHRAHPEVKPTKRTLTRKAYRRIRKPTAEDGRAWLRHRLAVRTWTANRLPRTGGATVPDPTKKGHETLRDLIHADAAHQATASDVIKADQAAKLIAPYAYDTYASEYLAECGIATPNVGTAVHQHPIHRTIENYILAKTLPNWGKDLVLFLWMKDWKAAPLASNGVLANMVGTVRDTLRYKKSYGGLLPRCDPKHAFIHDAAHFLPPRFLADLFAAYRSLESITFTLVIPAEVLLRLSSFKPGVYGITYVGKKFLYELEGRPEDHYEQDIECAKWLTLKSIDGHSLERMQTLGAHHVYRCTRALAPISKTLDSFPVPEAMVLPDDDSHTYPLEHRIVPRDSYEKTLSNARTIKGVYTIHSAAAKLATTLKRGRQGATGWMHPMAEQLMEAYALSHRASRVDTYSLASLSFFAPLTNLYYSFARFARPIARMVLPALIAIQVTAVYLIHRYASSIPYRFTTAGLECAASKLTTATLYGSRRLHALSIDDSIARVPCGWRFVDVPYWRQETRFFGVMTAQLRASLPALVETRFRWTGVNWFIKLLPLLVPRVPSSTYWLPDNRAIYLLALLPILGAPLLTFALFRIACCSLPNVTYAKFVAKRQAAPFRLIVELTDFSSSMFDRTTFGFTDDVCSTRISTHTAPAEEYEAPQFSSVDDDEDQPETTDLPDPGFCTTSSGLEMSITGRACEMKGNLCLFNAMAAITPFSAKHLFDLLQATTSEEDSAPKYHGRAWSTDHMLHILSIVGGRIELESESGTEFFGTGKLWGKIVHTSAGVGHFEAVIHKPTPTQPTEHTTRPVTNGGDLSISQIVALLRTAQYKGTRLAFDTAKLYDITVASAKDALNPSKVMIRAKYLASDYKNNFTGILLREMPHVAAKTAKKIDSLIDNCVRAPVQLIVLMGYNGCGKTAPLVAFLKANPSILSECKIACPENLLASQWTADLGLSGQDSFRVGSFETVCLLKTARILIVDEVGKMKNGYVDLCIALDPAIELVIVLGDVTQMGASETQKVNGKVQAKWIHVLNNEAIHFGKYADYYSLFTHRSTKSTARRWGVKTSNKTNGRISKSQLYLNAPAAVSAMSQASVDQYPSIRHAQTHASTQGATFEEIHDIALDYNFVVHADKFMINMLTNRSKKGINFSGTLSKRENNLLTANTVLSNFMAGVVQPVTELFAEELKGMKIITSPLMLVPEKKSGGLQGFESVAVTQHGMTATQKRNARKSRAKQGKQHMTHLTVDDLPAELTCGLSNLEAEKLKIVNPLYDPQTRVGTHFPAPELFDWVETQIIERDVDEREKIIGGERSNQFPEYSTIKNPTELPALKRITTTHKDKDDPTLLPGSKKKRLPKSNIAKNLSEMQKKKVAGQKLFRSFHKARGMTEGSVPFDSELFAQCIYESDLSKLSTKSMKVLMQAGPKSSADWGFAVARIFMKTQQKIKPDNLNGDWKAGQTIAQLNDQWLLLFGPVVRYIVKKDAERQKEHIFILGGSCLGSMADWCRKFIRGTRFTTNDYTAFDQSQGAEAVVFELMHMDYYGFDQSYRDVYEEQKTHMQHQFGRSAIMRFTGEPGTYKFNTMFSEALMNLQYDLSTPYMVSGDDSLIVGFAQTARTWAKDSKLFKIVSKTEFVEQPIFCGYIAAAAGIVREPIHFAIKLAVAVMEGRYDDIALSYATEYQHGFNLGGEVDEILNPEQREAHAVIGKYLYEHSPGRIRAMFSTINLSWADSMRLGVNTIAALKGKTIVEAYEAAVKGLRSSSEF